MSFLPFQLAVVDECPCLRRDNGAFVSSSDDDKSLAAHRRSVGTTKAAALFLLHDDPDIKLNIKRALNIAESMAWLLEA